MKIYFDVCCLNRPYDDQTQDRIHLESEAVIAILKHIELKEWSWVSSGVVSYEISKTPDEERKFRLRSLTNFVDEFILVEQGVLTRAKEIGKFSIGVYDALHIACAEQANATIFLTTDDNLLRNAKKHEKDINIEIENPLIWLQKVI